MKLKLTNIGMLKSANVKLDGLTVIAGENDTGKSTLGKTLFVLVKADNICRRSHKIPNEILATRLNLVFDGNVSLDGSVELLDDNQEEIAYAHITDKNFVQEFRYGKNDRNRQFFDATFVQSPIIFDLVDFFDSVNRLKDRQKMDYELDFSISYPYIFWDLYDKISNKNPFPRAKNLQEISDIIQGVIGGEFKKEGQKFTYNKYFTGRALQVDLANTAFGVRSFGILQLLSNNGYLNRRYVLILDEPEVHLHPAWQLKYAEIIAKLVRHGICVVVNSHSPYMIEALKVYSDKEGIADKTNFYLAEKENDGLLSTIRDTTGDLEPIFKKLADPFDTIEKIQIDSVEW